MISNEIPFLQKKMKYLILWCGLCYELNDGSASTMLRRDKFLSITVTSFLARLRLNSPASRLFTQAFIQTQIKENIKAPRHWPLCGEFTGDRGIPRTNGQ